MRVKELGTHFEIYGVCSRCRRSGRIEFEKLDPEMPLERLRQRVRCRGCGQHTRDIRIVYAWRSPLGAAPQ